MFGRSEEDKALAEAERARQEHERRQQAVAHAFAVSPQGQARLSAERGDLFLSGGSVSVSGRLVGHYLFRRSST